MAATHLILATTTPATGPTKAPEPLSVTPGLTGFAVIFTIAVVLLLLMVDMSRRLRRLRYRAQVRATEGESEAAPGRRHQV